MGMWGIFYIFPFQEVEAAEIMRASLNRADEEAGLPSDAS